MSVQRTIQNAYGCAAAATEDGWIGVAHVLPDVDADFVGAFNVRGQAELKAGTTVDEWSAAFQSLQRKVVAFRGDADADVVLSEPDRIGGIAACGAPAVVWTERTDGEWRLRLWNGSATRPLLSGAEPLLAPACAATDGGVMVACEVIRNGEEHVVLLDADGGRIAELPGRRPVFVPGLLVLERANGPESVTLHALRIVGGKTAVTIALPAADDLNMNAHACRDTHTGAVHVAHEACPAWGHDERIGLHRDIVLWRLDADADAFVCGAGTGNGRVPLPHEAFYDRSEQNFTLFAPRVALHQGRPAAAYRRFRFTGHKSHAWDICLTRFDGARWTDPACVSPNPGQPDGAYALLNVGGTLTGFFPACDNAPMNTFADQERWGEELGVEALPKDMRFQRAGYERPARDQRVEVVAIDPSAAPAPAQAPGGYFGAYAIPPGMRDLCPEPEGLPESPDGLTLIWGDLHPHSAYSKCMGANDGVPLDVIRMQRDVLGCRVLCLIEHTDSCRAPEFTHVYDTLELECAGRCVPLYGMESGGGKVAQHINFYARTRALYDRLRALPHKCPTEVEMYRAIHEEFGPREVLANRHMHGTAKGEFGIDSPRNVELHDPALEVAMEAMQTRGNMMLPGAGRQYAGPDFPSRFLDAGATVGLVGGSDHSRGGGPNYFCLTGFWVEEVTSDAVWDALINRRTFALSNGKIAMHAVLEGKPAGSEVAVDGPVRITAHLACGHTLLRAALIKDGALLPWQAIGAKAATVELVDEHPGPGPHWYVVTAQAATPYYHGLALGHASPFFVNSNRE